MEILIDSIIMAGLGFIGNYSLYPGKIPVAELFILLIFMAMNFILIEKKGRDRRNEIMYYVKKAFILIVLLISIFLPQLLLFAPVLILQNTWKKEEMPILFAAVLITSRTPLQFLIAAVLSILGIRLSYRRCRYEKLKEEYFKQKGESDYLYQNLRIENQKLIENQDIEIVNSALKERNRISKEIHDNVGHLLSSALLQLGALEFLISEDLKDPFLKLQATIKEAMEKTRKSVHGLYDKSLNMEILLKELKEGFTFCSLEYTVEIEKEPETSLYYTISSIVKEALSNVSKHSDADRVNIQLMEVRGDYHLLIKDNGSVKKQEEGRGLGLMSMRERVEDLGGNFYLNKENGYRIFITLPAKEREV